MTRSISNCKIRCRSAQARLVEPGPHPPAERLQVRPARPRLLPLGLQSLLLVTLGDEDMTSALDLFATDLQLNQLEHPGLVGVDQPLLLPAETLQLDLPSLHRGMAVVPRLDSPASPSNRAASEPGSSSMP